jgi:hypothetical protein
MMLTPLQIRQALGPVAHVWGVIYWVWAYYGGWNPLSSMPAARAFSAIQADPASD